MLVIYVDLRETDDELVDVLMDMYELKIGEFMEHHNLS